MKSSLKRNIALITLAILSVSAELKGQPDIKPSPKQHANQSTWIKHLQENENFLFQEENKQLLTRVLSEFMMFDASKGKSKTKKKDGRFQDSFIAKAEKLHGKDAGHYKQLQKAVYQLLNRMAEENRVLQKSDLKNYVTSLVKPVLAESEKSFQLHQELVQLLSYHYSSVPNMNGGSRRLLRSTQAGAEELNAKLEQFYKARDTVYSKISESPHFITVEEQNAARDLAILCFQRENIIRVLEERADNLDYLQQHCNICRHSAELFQSKDYWAAWSYLTPFSIPFDSTKNPPSGLFYEFEYLFPTVTRIAAIQNPLKYYEFSYLLRNKKIELEKTHFWKVLHTHHQKIGKIFAGKPALSFDSLVEEMRNDSKLSRRFFDSVSHIIYGNKFGDKFKTGRHSILAIVDEVNNLFSRENHRQLYFAFDVASAEEKLKLVSSGYVFEFQTIKSKTIPFGLVTHSKFDSKTKRKYSTFWPLKWNFGKVLDQCLQTYAEENKVPSSSGERDVYEKRLSLGYATRLIVSQDGNRVVSCFPVET